MIVFLYGKDSYSRGRKLREVLATYSEKMEGAKPVEFDFTGDEANSLTEELGLYMRSDSMFNERKFVLIINPYDSVDKKVFKKLLQESLEDKSKIIVINSESTPPKSFDFVLKKPAFSQAFPEIKRGKELDAFIQNEALTRGVKLTKDDVYHLSENFGADLWGIATELDMLELTKRGKIEEAISYDFFQTLSLMKYSSSSEEKLHALEILLSSRADEPAKIFNVLSAGLTDPEKINLLADFDVSIKTGKLDYEEALLSFALN